MKHIFSLIFIFIGINLFAQLELNKGFPLTCNWPSMCKHLDLSNDSYFISGEFTGDMDMDPDTTIFILSSYSPNQQSNIFFARYDFQSNLIFARSIGVFGSSGYIFVQDQILDSDKNIYLIGYFDQSVNFDPNVSNYTLTANTSAGSEIYFAKYDSLGNFIWAKKLGNTTSTQGGGKIAIDQNNNVYITGSFKGPLDFNPSSTATFFLSSSSGNEDPFVAKYDSNGNFIWANQYYSPSTQDLINDIKISPDNYLYLVGRFGQTLDFDFGTDTLAYTAMGTTDGFIAKYDLNANLIWAKTTTGNSYQSVARIAFDASNNLYTMGSFSVVSDLDPDTTVFNITPSGNTDLYFAAYDSDSCDFKWGKSLGGYSNDAIITGNFVVDNQSSIYITGGYDYTIDFDPSFTATYDLPGDASRNVFISKYDSLGNFIWVNYSEGQAYTGTTGIALINDTTIISIFYYSSNLDLDFTSNTFLVAQGDGAAIGIYNINDCGNISIQLDSLTDLSCSVPSGVINTTVINPLPSSQLEWDSNPTFYGDDLPITNNGIYILTYTDSTNCSLSRDVLVEGPNFFTNYDLRCNLIANTFRPGTNGSMIITGYNTTCNPAGQNIRLILDSLVHFDSAQIQPDYISGDTIVWNISNLIYPNNFESLLYYTCDTILTFTDTVCFNLEISPISGDQLPTNNTIYNCYPVAAAYDPNFKQVSPAGTGPEGFITNNVLMNYTIHFQNTGNAEAIDIYILDTISENLNMHTLVLTENSHDLTTEILFPGNIIKFKFNDIHLPDSANNEPESHGYVSYQIYQTPNLPIGETIKNTCYIYFDYNDPIKTNEVINTINEDIVSVNEIPNIGSNTFIYPNPVNDVLNFYLAEKSTIQIFNSLGQMVYEKSHPNGINSIHLNNIPNGVYLFYTKKEGESNCQKLIKY